MDLFRKSKENKIKALTEQVRLLETSQESRENKELILQSQISDIDKKISKLQEQKERLRLGIENSKTSGVNVQKQIKDLLVKIEELNQKIQKD